jgi:hypothetical protein
VCLRGLGLLPRWRRQLTPPFTLHASLLGSQASRM